MMWPWQRRTRIEQIVPPPPAPAERVEEAAAAKAEAMHRRDKTLEVLRVREEIRVRNHIGEDIGRAYLIINRGRV